MRRAILQRASGSGSGDHPSGAGGHPPESDEAKSGKASEYKISGSYEDALAVHRQFYDLCVDARDNGLTKVLFPIREEEKKLEGEAKGEAKRDVSPEISFVDQRTKIYLDGTWSSIEPLTCQLAGIERPRGGSWRRIRTSRCGPGLDRSMPLESMGLLISGGINTCDSCGEVGDQPRRIFLGDMERGRILVPSISVEPGIRHTEEKAFVEAFQREIMSKPLPCLVNITIDRRATDEEAKQGFAYIGGHNYCLYVLPPNGKNEPTVIPYQGYVSQYTLPDWFLSEKYVAKYGVNSSEQHGEKLSDYATQLSRLLSSREKTMQATYRELYHAKPEQEYVPSVEVKLAFKVESVSLEATAARLEREIAEFKVIKKEMEDKNYGAGNIYFFEKLWENIENRVRPYLREAGVTETEIRIKLEALRIEIGKATGFTLAPRTPPSDNRPSGKCIVM